MLAEKTPFRSYFMYLESNVHEESWCPSPSRPQERSWTRRAVAVDSMYFGKNYLSRGLKVCGYLSRGFLYQVLRSLLSPNSLKSFASSFAGSRLFRSPVYSHRLRSWRGVQEEEREPRGGLSDRDDHACIPSLFKNARIMEGNSEKSVEDRRRYNCGTCGTGDEAQNDYGNLSLRGEVSLRNKLLLRILALRLCRFGASSAPDQSCGARTCSK